MRERKKEKKKSIKLIDKLWSLEASIVSVDVGLGFYLSRFKWRMDYVRVQT